ncbi:hypothetical protein Q9L58_006911 [Maublancomyces gigas]|uniref:Uncharacterized protein n=1 Tax=Discina gigas TaxID=1032678 RepID=A0ABR3GE86_9PEZI
MAMLLRRTLFAPRARLLPLSLSLPLPQRRWGSGPAAGGGGDYQIGPANDVQPQPATQQLGQIKLVKDSGEGGGKDGEDKGDGKQQQQQQQHDWKQSSWKALEAAATTGVSLGVLGLAGFGYHKYYKHLVLQKINNAFNSGDPALNLATASLEEPWYNPGEGAGYIMPIRLPQQDHIDRIISGTEQGHYYLLIGEKGTGKTDMLLSAMHESEGEACSMMEAHADPEIFRLRLGKAIDFEFHEDYIGSLFSIRGPRDTTALLDIERALNKLEKVALRRRKAAGKPLIMIINSMHLLRNDDSGKDLLELLQQKAEAWAGSGLVTVVFNSDDYWVYERLKQYASRMQLISVRDLPKPRAVAALRGYRARWHKDSPSPADLDEVYTRVGGRLAFLKKVAREQDMLAKCDEICEDEKTWLMNKCGLLGTDMDDDVMDQQKFASAAMVLVRELVRMWDEHKETHGIDLGEHKLPELPLYRARQVMTRAEFIQEFDHDNIFTIDCKSMVRADSVPMMNAFIEVAKENGFNEYLEDTLTRISDIESLGRTREITIKDLWYGGKYNMTVKDRKGNTDKVITWDVTPGDRDADQGKD